MLLTLSLLPSLCRYCRCLCSAVFFASSDLATHLAGYMDGAIQSGERAAHGILVHLAKRGAAGAVSHRPAVVSTPSCCLQAVRLCSPLRVGCRCCAVQVHPGEFVEIETGAGAKVLFALTIHILPQFALTCVAGGACYVALAACDTGRP